MADSSSSSMWRFAPRFGFMLAALLLLAWMQRADGRLHLFFPALPGDAALIRFPSGGYALIDGGADPDALVSALGRRIPFWRRDLDLLILTTVDSQRLPGQVAALDRYQVRRAFAPPVPRATPTFAAWHERLAALGTPVRLLRAGQSVVLDGVRISALAVDADGALLRLDYGATTVVFAHAATPAMLERTPVARASLLVYPWQFDPHAPLVEAARPAAILFSDGARIEPPARATYRERALGGARLYHEALDGDLEWVSNGNHWTIQNLP